LLTWDPNWKFWGQIRGLKDPGKGASRFDLGQLGLGRVSFLGRRNKGGVLPGVFPHLF